MEKQKLTNARRIRRTFRVRKRTRGTSERPRLCVFRSHRNISVQVIDDELGRTLVSASSLDKDLTSAVGYGGNTAAAAKVGVAIAKKAKAAGITKVCFDRGAFKYHGRVAALAEAAREAGLEF